jgi:ketosteroid isomerase-like protein
VPDPSLPDGPVEDAVRRELTRFADDWAAAIVANDADAIGAYMAEDWVMVSETGISTRDDFLAAVRSGTLTHSAMDRVSPLQIRRIGDVAVLTARVTNTAHVGDSSSTPTSGPPIWRSATTTGGCACTARSRRPKSPTSAPDLRRTLLDQRAGVTESDDRVSGRGTGVRSATDRSAWSGPAGDS